jgi:Domain of unknown function (DUF4159)
LKANFWGVGHLRNILLAICCSFLGANLAAQPLISAGNSPPSENPSRPPDSEFNFSRLAYGSSMSGYSNRRGSRWNTDWPEAEYHLNQGIRRLSRVDDSGTSRIVRLTDEALFDFPFLYAVEVGSWTFTDDEARILREYLDRGGFLMTDDFHGTYQWQSFYTQFRKIFPDRPLVDIDESDEIFHVLYSVDKTIQIAGIRAIYSGQTWEGDGYVPQWKGVYDDDGRLMVIINFNMDLGDAWEHADNPYYPEPMTALAYRFGVNYLIYSMSH